RSMMERMGLKPGEVIDSPMVTRGIAKAQKKVEARNFDVRKHLIEYDEVMDKQRKFIYAQRQEALEYKGLRDKILGMFEEILEPVVLNHSADKDKPVEYDEIRAWLQHRCGDALDLTGLEQVPREQLFSWIMERVERLHDARAELYGEPWNDVMRFLILETIDNKWKDHLYAMEVLKQGVGLRGYAQVDPKNEYKKEGFEKFQQLKAEIAEHICGFVYKQEATDTIRDLVTGKLQQQRQQPPQQQMQMPSTPEELQALFESLIAAGKVPQEILDRMEQGEKFQLRATPQGLVLVPEGADPHVGQANPGGPAADAAPPSQLGAQPPQPPTPQQRLAPAQPPRAPQPPAPAAKPKPKPMGRPPGMPKPGRNDPCPCGSGIKYKKCCAPAFD
ncbi:MAG TPA: hypothetical protein ENI87_08585, partial [bacterium]|nr:hypothetical protein [bacterium]